ncbi:hypothetical protein GGQ71_001579 [Rhizobium taibaishanense]|uniref:Uncharacterized protein n=1 Tax=Allorhizobium taibaishanense TaxID=887144 RepID=A0A7W6HLK0_9HYPH|nr:hypothetical protein [Allorhizobium taibaishanense]
MYSTVQPFSNVAICTAFLERQNETQRYRLVLFSPGGRSLRQEDEGVAKPKIQ